MTREELREKVKDDAILKIHQGWSSDQIADAAIRVVLEAALNAPVVPPYRNGITKNWMTGHTNGIQDKCDAISALLPQDKDTGS